MVHLNIDIAFKVMLTMPVLLKQNSKEERLMKYSFLYNERLGIELPVLEQEWEEYSEKDRSDLLLRWEHIRGTIPDRIHKLEAVIIHKQSQLNREDDFPTSCQLNSEIAELASTINDLHLWFRINQEVDVKIHQ
jgi:hypothetical protein